MTRIYAVAQKAFGDLFQEKVTGSAVNRAGLPRRSATCDKRRVEYLQQAKFERGERDLPLLCHFLSCP